MMSFIHVSSPAGRYVAKGRNVVRCTGWRTVTCGAPLAAGKRPARDSLTERPPPPPANVAVWPTGCCLSPENGGGASFCMHLVFSSSTSQLSVKLCLCHSAPLNHSSCGSNQRTAESPFYIAVQDSQHCLAISIYSPFWETPVQLNSIKEKIDLKICPFFHVGFSVASFNVL